MAAGNYQTGKPEAKGFSMNPTKVNCTRCKAVNWIIANGVQWKCCVCGNMHE